MPAHHYSLVFQPYRSHGTLKTTVCSTPIPRLLLASHLRALAPGSPVLPMPDQQFPPLPHALHILSRLLHLLCHTLISLRSLTLHHQGGRRYPINFSSTFTFFPCFLVLPYFC